jgi:hypothetical protein
MSNKSDAQGRILVAYAAARSQDFAVRSLIEFDQIGHAFELCRSRLILAWLLDIDSASDSESGRGVGFKFRSGFDFDRDFANDSVVNPHHVPYQDLIPALLARGRRLL